MPILPNILRTLLSAMGNESISSRDLSRSDSNNNRGPARPPGRQRISMMNQERSMGDGFHNPPNLRTHVNTRHPTNNVVAPAILVNRTNNRKSQASSTKSRVEQKPSGKPGVSHNQAEIASQMQVLPKHKNSARLPKIKKTDWMTQTSNITKANLANWRKFTTTKGSQLTLRIKIYKTMLMFDNGKGISFQKLKKYLNIVYGYNPKQIHTLKKYIIEAFENKMIQVITGKLFSGSFRITQKFKNCLLAANNKDIKLVPRPD